MKLFTKQELMNMLHANDISNGGLQDEALSILIVLGYLRKELQEWVTEKKEVRQRWIYIKIQSPLPCSCYDEKQDRHISFDWFNMGERKRFYKKDGTNKG
jgi:hypothetical protein